MQWVHLARKKCYFSQTRPPFPKNHRGHHYASLACIKFAFGGNSFWSQRNHRGHQATHSNSFIFLCCASCRCFVFAGLKTVKWRTSWCHPIVKSPSSIQKFQVHHSLSPWAPVSTAFKVTRHFSRGSPCSQEVCSDSCDKVWQRLAYQVPSYFQNWSGTFAERCFLYFLDSLQASLAA